VRRPPAAASIRGGRGCADLDSDVQEEVIRFDDWATLCELLDGHAAEALAKVRVSEKERFLVEAFVAAVAAAAAQPASGAGATGALASIVSRV